MQALCRKSKPCSVVVLSKMQALRIFSFPNLLKTFSNSSALRLQHKRSFFRSNPGRDSFKVQDLNDFNERVKNSKKPVIVDFFATWCNPCKALTPRLESVIAETNGKVDLAKVDIDEHSDLALEFDVGSVPVLLLIRNGKVEERLVGLQDVDKLRKFVDRGVTE